MKCLYTFTLHQVRLTNPSNKPLTYHAMVAGRDARDFTIPRGSQVMIQPKGKQDLPVIFTSRFLRPAEAVLVLVGRRVGAACGTTLVFNLKTAIDNITPTVSLVNLLSSKEPVLSLLHIVLLEYQMFCLTCIVEHKHSHTYVL